MSHAYEQMTSEVGVMDEEERQGVKFVGTERASVGKS
jgi:hypothetical protein